MLENLALITANDLIDPGIIHTVIHVVIPTES